MFATRQLSVSLVSRSGRSDGAEWYLPVKWYSGETLATFPVHDYRYRLTGPLGHYAVLVVAVAVDNRPKDPVVVIKQPTVVTFRLSPGLIGVLLWVLVQKKQLWSMTTHWSITMLQDLNRMVPHRVPPSNPVDDGWVLAFRFGRSVRLSCLLTLEVNFLLRFCLSCSSSLFSTSLSLRSQNKYHWASLGKWGWYWQELVPTSRTFQATLEELVSGIHRKGILFWRVATNPKSIPKPPKFWIEFCTHRKTDESHLVD